MRSKSDSGSEKRRRLAIATMLGFTGSLVVVALVLLSAWPPVNEVEAGQSAEYRSLVPMAYALREERVFAGVVAALGAMENVAIETNDATSGVVEALRSHRLPLLSTRLTVRVAPNGEGGSIVHIKSATEHGGADFGQNARNIVELQRVLAHAIGSPQIPVSGVVQPEFAGSTDSR